YTITLDVGGTSIKAALIKHIFTDGIQFQLVEQSYKTYSSKSSEDCETIINNLVTIIKDQYHLIEDNDFLISSISFGFPGPFDYNNATSFMQGIDKFDSIYNMNLEKELQKKLTTLHLAKLSADITIVFENDATLFALGEYHISNLKKYSRIIFITLGTGCGSTFLAEGKIVKGAFGVPQNGMIFDVSFRDGIIDNYISRRYILSLAKDASFDITKVDVKDLMEFAQSGDKNAIQIFARFGTILGKALYSFIKSFQADAILFGGQISKAYPLFQSSFENEILPMQPKIIRSQNLSKSALIGAAVYAQNVNKVQ
ncbi:MAG: ROK family protein, partial [Oscillospiraceae bacterium]